MPAVTTSSWRIRNCGGRAGRPSSVLRSCHPIHNAGIENRSNATNHSRQTTNTTKIPTYNVIDGGVRKRLAGNVGIDLYLYNLTNELYATDFYYNGYAPQWMLGAPRSAEVALTVGF